jgi:hypothetical protein
MACCSLAACTGSVSILTPHKTRLRSGELIAISVSGRPMTRPQLGRGRFRSQNSRHGENIQLIGEGHGDGHSGRSALHRCRSTTCRVSSRGLEASRGHRLCRLSSRRCSHVSAHLQHSRCAKTVARQQTWLAGSPPMSGVLESHGSRYRERHSGPPWDKHHSAQIASPRRSSDRSHRASAPADSCVGSDPTLPVPYAR